MTAPDTTPSATLAAIRERGYRNGATGAECARLSDAAAVDIPLLVAAVEAVLALADGWEEGSFRLDIGAAVMDGCARELREAITSALTGEERSDGK